MPDPYERHGRQQSWDAWGAVPSRSQQRDAAAHDDPARRTPPSKSKKGVCKGPDGWHEAHDLVFVIQPERIHWGKLWDAAGSRAECAWTAAWSIREQKYTVQWSCLHSQVCSRCLHREREHWDMTRVLCPSYTGAEQHPVPQEVLEEVTRRQAEADEQAARRKALRAAPKPWIKGPQGYRRRKGGG